MEKSLTNIVDLDKYPIHDLNSPKIKKIIEKCKTELDSDSCSVIPNFILPNSLNVMKKELEQQLDEVYMSKESINAYLTQKTTQLFLKIIQKEYLWIDLMDI